MSDDEGEGTTNKAAAAALGNISKQLERSADLTKYVLGGMAALAFLIINFSGTAMGLDGRFGTLEAIASLAALACCMASVLACLVGYTQLHKVILALEAISVYASINAVDKVTAKTDAAVKAFDRMERQNLLGVGMIIACVAAAVSLIAFAVIVF